MSVLFCTPAYGRQVTLGFFQSAVCLKENLILSGVEHDWLTLGNESLITRGRDTCAATFLKSHYDRLMFIDADIEFQVEDVIKLWNLDADIACGVYRMKKLDAGLTVWKDSKLVDLDNFKEPFEVDFAGTGFLMIKRRVFDSLIEKYPEWHYRDGEPEEDRWGFFQDPIVDGWKASEDYFFIEKAREAGFKCICDPSIRLTHWGTHGF